MFVDSSERIREVKWVDRMACRLWVRNTGEVGTRRVKYQM